MPTPTSDKTTRLILRRRFQAPREQVFRAWTRREALQQWFRPLGRPVTVSKLEAWAGGSFSFDLADGSNSAHGTYLEVVRPARLVFTWSFTSTQDMDTVVTVEFLEHGSTTEVILTHERLNNEEMRSRHQVGWQSLLEHLAEALPTLRDD